MKRKLFDRYYETNIPVNYWDLAMPVQRNVGNLPKWLRFRELVKEFNNAREGIDEYCDEFFGKVAEIDKIYFESIIDISKSYMNGLSYCLAGTHGVGKTLTATNILKDIVANNFTGLYTTLSDVVSVLTTASNEDKFNARKELMEVDFLVIDEFDSRFISTESSADLFGRTLENILRSRLQNKLPIILVTNSPNPVETFNGSLKKSLESLMNQVPLKVVMGKDHRKENV
jgi:DNA replication protein DnaC